MSAEPDFGAVPAAPAMSRSAESLDLTEVYEVLQRWRDIATMTTSTLRHCADSRPGARHDRH